MSEERGDPQKNFEQIVSMAKGPKGDQGERGSRGQRGLSQLQGRAIVVLFLLSALFGAGNLFWTAHEVKASAAAQARTQAAAARAAQKTAIPLCTALLHLSQIKGTHGDSGATYGANLERGLQGVYAATNCPRILEGKS